MEAELPRVWHGCGEGKACQGVWANGRLVGGGGGNREEGSPKGDSLPLR